MKKVININFQGQIIPIEETAYEMLQQYVASLRNYFANEEGRDEIINDIESRIAELFGETLKKGAACITDDEVNRIMDSMGRPADFEAAEQGTDSSGHEKKQEEPSGTYTAFGDTDFAGRKRLYRDEQDKIIGGVASGLANYFKIDPAIIRVLFVALFFGGGSGLLIYIILWIILPSRSLVTNIRKRLYRDPDDKVIGGVASGLAKYFDISPAIPRVIFAAPFIISIITSLWNSMFSFFPSVISGFGGGTFIMAYIILWIVLPEARTAAEKLEMRGEKVDLNSIRNTIVSDLEGMKAKAQTMGQEITESAKKAGQQIKEGIAETSAQMGPEIRYAATRNSNGIGNALGILVKAFVYFVVGIVAFALFMASIGLFVGGVTVYPLHDFLLQGSTQHLAAWGTLVLFLGVPMLALLVFIIRRLMRVKTPNPYIGYTFTALWLVGLFAFFTLVATLRRSFSTQVGIRQEVEMMQPNSDKILVTMAPEGKVVVWDDWFHNEGFLNISRDSLYLNTVKVTVQKSKDGLYHAYLMKISKGNDRDNAERRAEKIAFNIEQRDSIVYLPANFTVSRHDKWRNQKIVVVFEVPEGKYIELDESLDDYDYFNIQLNRRNRYGDWEFDWDNETHNLRKGTKLRMTPGGLEKESNESKGWRYRFDSDGEDINIEGDIKTEENKEKDTEKPTIQIEQKEKEVYRYSNVQSDEPSLNIVKKLRISSNPLNAMLKF